MATTKTTKAKATSDKKPAEVKAVAVKKTAAKTVAKKVVAVKKESAKKTPNARPIGAEERYKMIEVAAYYIAERNHFKGSATDFWIAAEAEISNKIGK
jgi:hypothetical protein